MCFSATASTVAATFLTLISGYSIYKARMRTPFTAIPLFFAVQQWAEVYVWYAQSNTAAYLFLFFATVFWPAYIPYALVQQEHSQYRLKLLYALLIYGLLYATYTCYTLYQLPIDVSFVTGNIIYTLGSNPTWGIIAYCSATILPFLVSSIKYAWLYAIAITLSLLITLFFWNAALISVWCFFAALISSLVAFTA